MKEIVLASSSPRRSELLKQLGLEFKIIPADIDEKIDKDKSVEQLAQDLSFEKALSISRQINSNAVVIGADTLVFKDRVLGKPQDEDQARNMLRSLQNEWHEVITGISLIDAKSLKSFTTYEKTRVKMREMSNEFIDAYIKTGEPMDKAGAYGIQGIGSILVEKIEGCYFNVVGLPLMKLNNILEEFGISIL